MVWHKGETGIVKRVPRIREKDIPAALKEIHDIKMYMQNSRITNEGIAELLSVSKRSIKYWKSGQQYPCRAVCNNIFKLLRKVRQERLEDIRQVNDPIGELPAKNKIEEAEKAKKAKIDSPW